MHWWQAARLYLEQSVSREGKGNAAVSRDTLGHFSSIPLWHRRAQGRCNQGGGFSHENTDSAHRAKGFVSQQVTDLRVGALPGARHSGGLSAGMWLSCLGTWRDNSSHQPGAQELEPLTKTDLSWPGTASPAATAL